jgi:hypothetical protein
MASNPGGIASAVQHGINNNIAIQFSVIDRKGEAFGKHPMETKVPGMDAPKVGEGINVRKKGIQKIGSKPSGLYFIKLRALHEIRLGGPKDLYFGSSRFRVGEIRQVM